MVNGRSVLAPSSASAQRFKQRDKGFDNPSYSFVLRHIAALHASYKKGNYQGVPYEKTYRLTSIQSSFVSVISIQMKAQDHICDANAVGVCLRAACMCGRYNVSLCIPHTCSIRTRALWILISHFVISRYPAGEVCALECEASVCLDVTRGSAGDLHFSISGASSRT